MVHFEEDTANQRCVCKSDKFVSDIIIEKSIGGYRFFEIKFTKGVMPNELSGKYSSMKMAKIAVETYVRKKKKTKGARREYFSKAREERKVENAAKTKPKGSKHVHQGPDN
jgi:hypothetical protein|tara:strand:+ start:516 stop:848 length:333 start_codon:yes stop_codon:yes gene_type:complete